MLKNKIFGLPRRFAPRNNRMGFTLAEILIAVIIIGTISALTISTYFTSSASMNNNYVAGLKKAYAELNYATEQIKANNSGTLANAFSDSDAVVTKYCTYMKCAKTCSSGAAVSGGCFNDQADMKSLSNGSFEVDPTTADYRTFILSDGILILTNLDSSNCSSTINTITSICGWFYIDINGFKVPNITGRDIYKFLLNANGLVLLDSSSCLTSSSGLGCAESVLKEGKMMY